MEVGQVVKIKGQPDATLTVIAAHGQACKCVYFSCGTHVIVEIPEAALECADPEKIAVVEEPTKPLTRKRPLS